MADTSRAVEELLIDPATGLPYAGGDPVPVVAYQGASASFPGGGTQAATTGAAALNGGASLACAEVCVQNDPGSANNLLVGGSSAQPIALTPGSGMSLQINDVSKVFIKIASGSATANWLARS